MDTNMNVFFPVREETLKTVDSGKIVNKKAIINSETNKVVSVVSDNYKLVSNLEITEWFENYLKETDVPFRRIGIYGNESGSKFWAKYRFPETISEIGPPRVTPFGKKVPDKVEMMATLQNSYDGSLAHGFDIGGYRLVCLNGLMVPMDNIHVWRQKHTINFSDVVDTIAINFQTMKDHFEAVSKEWKALTQQEFNAKKTLTVLRALELSKMYQSWLAETYKDYRRNQKLNTMWDVYNMVTWFATHVVEQRNRILAKQINTTAFQNLVG